MSEITTLLLADDHAILRSGLRLLVEGQPDFKVVGEAGTGKEAIAKARDLRPNVILLDLNMPELDGLAALPTILRKSPDSRRLILAIVDDVSYLQEALHTGASGYILKKAVDSNLIGNSHSDARRNLHPFRHDAKAAAKNRSAGGQTRARSRPVGDALRARAQCAAVGRARLYQRRNRQRTVFERENGETYRTRGMEKLNFQTRAQLVKAALKKVCWSKSV